MESEQPKSMQKIMHQNYFKTMQSKTKMKIGYYKMLQRSVYWFCLLALIIICTIEVGIPKVLEQEFLESFCCKKSPNQEIGLGRFSE